jgi:predicted RNase H-like nuclease
MSRIAAVVGCKEGWYVLRETPLPGPWHWFIASSFAKAMERLESYDVVALDVPLSVFEAEATNGSAAGIHERYRQPVSKVQEVHDYIRANPGIAHYLFEVHPHLSFLELEGGFAASEHPRDKLRLRDRLSCLCDVYPSGTLYDALTAYPRSEVGKIDILDAFAMLWSAKRIATSRAERLPSTPVFDARGFDMAIWY